VFFFDEAHLLFRDASKAFLEQVEQVVRLIRSKGVGIFFVTQTPKDVPEDVLAQLSNRVQHALRAHTPDDVKDLKAAVRTFPRTEHYDLERTLTTLGIGEAVITGLDPRGIPTPVVAARLLPPASRMGPLTPEELRAELAESDLMAEYGTAIDRESAREILERRLERSEPRQAPVRGSDAPPTRESAAPGHRTGVAAAIGGGLIAALGTTAARALGRELVRGLFGMLGRKPPRSTRRRR